MEKVQLVNNSANNYPRGEPVIALRPFMSPQKMAAPSFEVVAGPACSVVERAPDIMTFLDNSLPAMYRGQTCVSVSLDAEEVFDKSFPGDLQKKIELQNLEPARLWLEICESTVLSETARQRVIPELADCGFRVVVKRFIADSTGFDILASPHIAGIKVSAPVVAGLPRSILARRFLRGLQTLANAVNKQLIIDGVETLSQVLWLETVGCKIFQGSLYGPAMPPCRARRFIVEGRQHVAPIVLSRV